MKKRNRLYFIALQELRVNSRSFLMTACISVLLLTALTAILSIASQIPDALNQYVNDSAFSTMRIENVRYEDLEFLETIQINVSDLLVESETELSVGLPEDWLPDFKITTESEGGGARYMRNMTEDCTIRNINRNLCEGKEWTALEDRHDGLWLSAGAAEVLGVHAGDIISLTARRYASATFEEAIASDPEADIEPEWMNTISVPVSGIYREFTQCKSYYYTLPLYLSCCRQEPEGITVFAKCQNVLHFHRIKNLLNTHFLSVDAKYEIIDSMLFLIAALYIICICLTIMEIMMIYSMVQNYFHQRVQVFGLLRALGLSRGGMLFVISMLFLSVLTICFGIALLLSPFMIQYVVHVIEDVFPDITLHVSHRNILIPAIYAVLSAAILCICLLHLREYRSAYLSQLLRNGDETK